MKFLTIYRSILFQPKNFGINTGSLLRHFVRQIHEDAQVEIEVESYGKPVPEEDPDGENVIVRRSVPASVAEYRARKSLKPLQPPEPHLLKVAIIGEPNAGKSTLTNRFVKWKVCPVSKKVHTTRKNSTAMFVEEQKQIVFLDTPGFITHEQGKKHKLEVSMVVDPEKSIREADLIAVISDVSNKWTNKRIHEDLLELLNNHRNKQSILVLNKVDALKQREQALNIIRALTRGALNGSPDLSLREKRRMEKVKKSSLEEIFEETGNKSIKEVPEEEKSIEEESVVVNPEESLEHFQGAKGWPFFSNVFMVSALKGLGVDELRKFFLDSAKPKNWLYHESNVIDKHPHDIAKATVREVLLDELSEEIPYTLSLGLKSWTIDGSGCLRIHMVINCEKPHHKRIIIGKSGMRIGKLVENARQALQDTFRSEIYLRLGVS